MACIDGRELSEVEGSLNHATLGLESHPCRLIGSPVENPEKDCAIDERDQGLMRGSEPNDVVSWIEWAEEQDRVVTRCDVTTLERYGHWLRIGHCCEQDSLCLCFGIEMTYLDIHVSNS